MNPRARSLFLLALLTSLVAAGCSSGLSIFPTGQFMLKDTRYLASVTPAEAVAHRELDKTVLPAYFVQPGDVLLIEPVDYTTELRFPADQVVLPDGTIDLGGYGRLIVASKTIEEIELMVESRIEMIEREDIEPINVRLIDPQGAVFYVLGELNAPGAYPLIGRETVLDAIMAAGGLTDRASPCDIVLSRPTRPGGCRIVLPVCYRQIVQMGDTTTNYQIFPGDRIFVGARSFCEDLMFWKASKPCSHCGWRIQCACPDPNMAESFAPTITTLPPSPTLMRLPPPTDEPNLPIPPHAIPPDVEAAMAPRVFSVDR